MTRPSFISGQQLYRQLNAAWKLPGTVRDVVIRVEFDKPVLVEVTQVATKPESSALVDVLSQYQLLLVQPWIWLAKAHPETAEPPRFVEWDPAALPPDTDIDAPVLYWTWDGQTVELMQWFRDVWWDRDDPLFAFPGESRSVLAWQPLSAPPGPAPRKDPS